MAQPDDVAGLVEADAGLAAQHQPLGRAGFDQGRFAGVGIQLGGDEAHQAQDHRPVGGMAASGQGQGGIEPDLDPGDVGQAPSIAPTCPLVMAHEARMAMRPVSKVMVEAKDSRTAK